MGDTGRRRTTGKGSNIKKMPYEIRLRNYEKEKMEMLRKATNVPIGQLSIRLKEIADKWGI